MMDSPLVVHWTERLVPGGGLSVIEGFLFMKEAADRSAIYTSHVEPVYASRLKRQGLSVQLLTSHAELLDGIRDRRAAVVLHSSGERSGTRDALLGALACLPACIVLERNIFGYVDDGPAAGRIDLHLFNSMHTMWRHWTLRGRPPLDSYLERHRTLYNPVALHADCARLLALRTRGRARLGIPPDAFVVGDVCRPDPRKLDYMLAAIARRLDREVGGLHVMTQRFPEGVAAALRRVLGDRYHNLPFAVDRDALLETYAAMDAFAHFSTMGESFGMAVAEAMRCGLPVVANETPGAKQNNAQPELIEEGRTGFFANDPYTAVRRLAELAGDAALRRRLGQAGAARFAMPPLAPASIARQLEAEIARLAAARGLGPAPADYERLPSRAEEAAYLASYRPRHAVPPLPAPAAERPWRLAADARRLTWRARRRLDA